MAMAELSKSRRWAIALWWLFISVFQVGPLGERLASEGRPGHDMAAALYRASVIAVIAITLGIIGNKRWGRVVAAIVLVLVTIGMAAWTSGRHVAKLLGMGTGGAGRWAVRDRPTGTGALHPFESSRIQSL